MDLQQKQSHWLDLYASKRLDWQYEGARNILYRNMGIVENMFDTDGVDFEGRADVAVNLHAEIKTTLDHKKLRRRILLAWAVMRQSHALLCCRSAFKQDFLHGCTSHAWVDKCFVYRVPSDVQKAIDDALEQTTFMEDHYPDLDVKDFFEHLTNSGRALDPHSALAKIYVMPSSLTIDGKMNIHVILVYAHQIVDGLTIFRWGNNLIRLLNTTEKQLMQTLRDLIDPTKRAYRKIPPAQESLYPVRSANKARDRWMWAITRILRHVRRPPPAAFQNPLRRESPITNVKALPPRYSDVLDYSRVPMLNTYTSKPKLNKRATHNLTRLSRNAGITLGSGGFTLAAMIMMEFEERRHPDIPLDERLPFVGSFPVNPRPFLSGEPTTGKEESCMLAFSDGVSLPFLPSDLPFEGRFKVLGRLAHKQLRQYQKRKRSAEEEIHMGSRSPSQLLPLLYLSTLDRMEARAKPEHKAGFNTQGAYPPTESATMATCGISSVGDISGLLASGKVDISTIPEGKDLVADYRGLGSVVRARVGEFLVGSAGDKDYLGYTVSYDGCAIDPERVKDWEYTMENCLDRDMFGDPNSINASTRMSKI